MTKIITSDGFSSVKSTISKRERKGKLVVDISFRNGMTLDEKYSLMNALHKAAEQIIEERN
jgi:hypothetical protein